MRGDCWLVGCGKILMHNDGGANRPSMLSALGHPLLQSLKFGIESHEVHSRPSPEDRSGEDMAAAAPPAVEAALMLRGGSGYDDASPSPSPAGAVNLWTGRRDWRCWCTLSIEGLARASQS